MCTPSELGPSSDAGDETARRYRFQWTYAAVACCIMLDETEDIHELFCEHHEDILLRHSDGTFTGVQVKTRSSDQSVWKASDQAVVSSCARFANLEAQFPERFRAYRFLTNHPIYGEKNGEDLRHVLRGIREHSGDAGLPRGAKRFVKKVATKAQCPEQCVIAALSKAEADDDLPKLADVSTRLVTTLTLVWERASEWSHASVCRAAQSLVEECARASSLAHEDVLPAYVPLTARPSQARSTARIAQKRFRKHRVIALLEKHTDGVAPLDGPPESQVEPGTGEPSLLSKKLDAGGFSAVSLNSADDLRDKADYLGLVWTQKYGRESGLQRYGHIRSVVLNDAARCFEAVQRPESKFGPQMLREMRLRFAERRREGCQLYDCSNEHLEGFAFSLTSECKIQWSLERPWEQE
ncbi:MAG: DUF4297 domain-containing protein [Acidobacteria bacterium]|nr:DUF4297 domain-containing protein [Acidobacteriota bacterium]